MILAAITYAQRGYPVFPCHHIHEAACSCGHGDCGSPGKHPRTQRGVLDATSDQARVVEWWQHWPQANIGLACGAPSGFYLIDLDGEKGALEWARLQDEYGDSPTLMARTGGGGYHLYYALPVGVDLANTAKRVDEHIDTRGTGGYVLMPPSTHSSGHKYEWVGGRVATLPQWIIDRVTSRRPEKPRLVAPAGRALQDDELALRILRDEVAAIRATGEGARNNSLFLHSARVFELAFGGELTGATVWNAMELAGEAAGLAPREVRATLESAIRHAREHPRRIRTRQEGQL